MDVQNTPPVFKTGSLTGIVNEDDPVGTAVVTVTAMDGDSGNPRRVIYDLLENPNDYFVIDQNSGEIRVDRALDRESLGPSSGILRLKVIIILHYIGVYFCAFSGRYFTFLDISFLTKLRQMQLSFTQGFFGIFLASTN